MDQTALHDFAIFPPDAQSIFVMDQDAERRDRSGQGSVEETEGTAMKREKLELVRGGGNVFRDLGRDNADIEQLKALLAAEIIKALDRAGLTVRAAHARTGFAAADFLTHSERRSRQVHCRPACIDSQPSRIACRGEDPGPARRNAVVCG
jgi:hypothetical protein